MLQEKELGAEQLAATLKACEPPGGGKGAEALEGTDALRSLLRSLGARGSATNEEATAAMAYGTAARSAIDGLLGGGG